MKNKPTVKIKVSTEPMGYEQIDIGPGELGGTKVFYGIVMDDPTKPESFPMVFRSVEGQLRKPLRAVDLTRIWLNFAYDLARNEDVPDQLRSLAAFTFKQGLPLVREAAGLEVDPEEDQAQKEKAEKPFEPRPPPEESDAT